MRWLIYFAIAIPVSIAAAAAAVGAPFGATLTVLLGAEWLIAAMLVLDSMQARRP
jgi:hypothetical protein